ncbi:hypothetical protein SETIT_9G066600v2 [Setaria italica]|uniref:Uncharacterized protein n=1 Tax=Setaria italica TaxID=4555 RepID=A0A368SDQ8_SETIT|nr:hypothetical protein SETIT_9G066600v2 [Setaria italica]
MEGTGTNSEGGMIFRRWTLGVSKTQKHHHCSWAGGRHAGSKEISARSLLRGEGKLSNLKTKLMTSTSCIKT